MMIQEDPQDAKNMQLTEATFQLLKGGYTSCKVLFWPFYKSTPPFSMCGVSCKNMTLHHQKINRHGEKNKKDFTCTI